MRDYKKSSVYMELCLCRRCASVYFNDSAYRIKRAEIFQAELGPCDICQQYRGVDYKIWKKPNVRFQKSHR